MTITENHLPRRHAGDRPAVAPAGTSRDPVCGMTVDPATAKHHAEQAGQDFYFCSAGCRGKFVANPGNYLVPPPAPVPIKGAIYTCPMHPEIRQEGPGSCPICGMALEPDMVTAEAPENHELADMTRRFWIALALASPVVVLAMSAHLPWSGLRELVP